MMLCPRDRKRYGDGEQKRADEVDRQQAVKRVVAAAESHDTRQKLGARIAASMELEERSMVSSPPAGCVAAAGERSIRERRAALITRHGPGQAGSAVYCRARSSAPVGGGERHRRASSRGGHLGAVIRIRTSPGRTRDLRQSTSDATSRPFTSTSHATVMLCTTNAVMMRGQSRALRRVSGGGSRRERPMPSTAATAKLLGSALPVMSRYSAVSPAASGTRPNTAFLTAWIMATLRERRRCMRWDRRSTRQCRPRR